MPVRSSIVVLLVVAVLGVAGWWVWSAVGGSVGLPEGGGRGEGRGVRPDVAFGEVGAGAGSVVDGDPAAGVRREEVGESVEVDGELVGAAVGEGPVTFELLGGAGAIGGVVGLVVGGEERDEIAFSGRRIEIDLVAGLQEVRIRAERYVPLHFAVERGDAGETFELSLTAAVRLSVSVVDDAGVPIPRLPVLCRQERSENTPEEDRLAAWPEAWEGVSDARGMCLVDGVVPGLVFVFGGDRLDLKTGRSQGDLAAGDHHLELSIERYPQDRVAWVQFELAEMPEPEIGDDGELDGYFVKRAEDGPSSRAATLEIDGGVIRYIGVRYEIVDCGAGRAECAVTLPDDGSKPGRFVVGALELRSGAVAAFSEPFEVERGGRRDVVLRWPDGMPRVR